MLRTFIRASKLKRWLWRDDCPQAIKECKKLFDKCYPRKASEDTKPEAEFSVKISPARDIPSDLRPLIGKRQVGLQARLRHQGIVYTRASTHLGNSLVLFYPRGDTSSPPVPGSIKYIFSHNSVVALAVQRQTPLLPSEGVEDPFSRYPHFPARLYKNTMEEKLEEARPEWIMCHYARYSVSSLHAVVLNVSKVNTFGRLLRTTLIVSLQE